MTKNIYDGKVKKLLNRGDNFKYSHMIILKNNNDLDFVPIFVKRSENIKDILFNIYNYSDYEIEEIYNYDLNLESQITEHKTYHINTNFNKINRAYELAKEKHKGQVRLGGSSYITHPINVAKIVGKYYYNHPNINELLTAAYLHDLIEDTDVTVEDIKEEFGDYVAHLVKGVTTNQDEKKKIGKTNYLCNKMLNMDEDVLSLKLCDRLANVFDLENAPSEFADKYTAETLVIISYLLSNRDLDLIKKEIIKNIHIQLFSLRNQKTPKMAKKIK